MNISPAHWHLLLNHFPVVLCITGSFFLIVAFIFEKNELLSKGLLLIIVAILFIWPVHKTGKNAEDPVEVIAGISHQAIHEHEDNALTVLRLTIATGILTTTSLWLEKHNPKLFIAASLITLMLAMATGGYLGNFSYAGGEIQRAEIRGEMFSK